MKKIFIVKPPRKVWPYLSEEDNYLLPQALPAIAAAIREKISDVDIKIIDCLPYKIGWKSLKKIISKNKPDLLLLSESELVWVNEANKLAVFTKKASPKTKIIAGGVCYSFLPEFFLRKYPIDYIVIGEGERTIVELLNEIIRGKERSKILKKIKGIAYKNSNKVVITQHRELEPNLDNFPLPAYDLMSMGHYTHLRNIFHPGAVTVYHSKGCVNNCKYCICWVSNAKRFKKNGKIIYKPCYRTKSVERTIKEIELLYKKYGVRSIVFTDDIWNQDPEWSKQFAKEILKRNIKIKWFAFLRAETVVRDEKLGILDLLVKAGLSHAVIGVERLNDKEMRDLKRNSSKKITFQAFNILKRRYPQVFRQGTFIMGTRNENKESMIDLLKQIKKLDIDMPSFSPLTPLPGTPLYEEAKKNGRIESENFEDYDWFTPIMSSEHLSRDEIEDLMNYVNRKHFDLKKFLLNLFSPYAYKRKMYYWFVKVTLRIIMSELIENYFLFWKIKKPFSKLIPPKHYYD